MNDFDGLRYSFEDICAKYQVRGFDRGMFITPFTETVITKKRDDSETFLTQSYLVIPGKLSEPEANFSAYTNDPQLLEAIKLIREEFLNEGAPYPKAGRAMRGDDRNWIKAQWVNGVTYNDFSPSCAKSRVLDFNSRLELGEDVEFNLIVNPGAERPC
ncbi:MAG: hypothetical protein ACLR17_06100 [Enterobacteriaceae bacterium]